MTLTLSIVWCSKIEFHHLSLFYMIGIIVQLLISWLLIWFFCKENLSVLGMKPNAERTSMFFIFLAVTIFSCSSGFFLRMYFGKESWVLNPLFSTELLFKGIWWNLKSVLFEELIFRGVILYILIKKLGSTKAILISSVAFGIYHWFSFEVIGNVSSMVQVFLLTGAVGLLYAYGYVKTNSLYVPIAMHFGWNFTKGFLFSEGSIGNGIFVQVKPIPVVSVSYFVYYSVMLTPFILFFCLNYLLLFRKSTSIS